MTVDEYREYMRGSLALRLARDIDTCRALIAGEPVDPARLNPHAVREARGKRLVRLDFAELDRLGDAMRRTRLIEILRETDPARLRVAA